MLCHGRERQLLHRLRLIYGSRLDIKVVACRLERLELGTCGRGFGDVAAAAVAGKGPLPGLRSLALGGAYRLRNFDLEKLLVRAPDLEQLRLPQCSLLQAAGYIPQFCPKIRYTEASLTLSPEITWVQHYKETGCLVEECAAALCGTSSVGSAWTSVLCAHQRKAAVSTLFACYSGCDICVTQC